MSERKPKPPSAQCKDKGKWAEDRAVEWLVDQTQEHQDFAYHRFPDARAARGALAPQPADYLVACGWWRPFFLEVKETAEKNRLPKSKVSQYGKLLMFWWAGMVPRVLVYRSQYDDWIYFTEKELFRPAEGTVDETPKSFPFEGRQSYPTAGAALCDITKGIP